LLHLPFESFSLEWLTLTLINSRNQHEISMLLSLYNIPDSNSSDKSWYLPYLVSC
jgi:hypothetical protein